MTAITVVIPTLTGREELLERTLAAYEENTTAGTELEIIVVKNRASCGEAWAAENGTADLVHLAADDILPHEGWDTGGWQDGSFLPSPLILRPDGSVEACGSMGGGMLLQDCRTATRCNVSQFPAMPRTVWEEIRPDVLPIHYYSDDQISYLWSREISRTRPTATVQVDRTYTFTHLEGIVGRESVVRRSGTDRKRYLDFVAGRQ